MTAQTYAQAALLWGMLGFLAGYLTSSAWQAATDKFRGGHRRPRAALGALVLILAVVMTIQNYLYQRDRSRSIECQAQYNLAFSRALAERSKIADDDRANQNLLARTIARSPEREVMMKALDAYLRQQAANDAERRANPLPPVPTGQCGI
ncbi:hypothetical protein AB0P21_09820 [Kribbella sp. NPDC056861]|uniref:hypothetical protein n=1 Tax=Kribbella sp. NPDC056861 TaxID=3154857 RepID=UPI00343C7D52